MLLRNVESASHGTTEALFLDTPLLCEYRWENWNGIRNYTRTPLTLAVCYNGTWLVRFLITKTECDTTFAEAPACPSPNDNPYPNHNHNPELQDWCVLPHKDSNARCYEADIALEHALDLGHKASWT